jgi:hypothetical protein
MLAHVIILILEAVPVAVPQKWAEVPVVRWLISIILL